jgi:hypothetical protein
LLCLPVGLQPLARWFVVLLQARLGYCCCSPR